MNNIAIFASGSGTNAEQIIRYFENDPIGRIKLILSNKRDAYVLQRAASHQLPAFVFNRDRFYQTTDLLDELVSYNIDLLVLAGFLWLVPDYLLNAYPRRIINIHPALLPDFGGKGMYGQKVHEAVLASGAKKSGITIHVIDNEYDRGTILFQAECPVFPGDTPETLAARIHELEYRHFPEQIKKYLQSL
jgi:phosphoribosylglycinamide formyltransferase-1